jgi:hypothetical protein
MPMTPVSRCFQVDALMSHVFKPATESILAWCAGFPACADQNVFRISAYISYDYTRFRAVFEQPFDLFVDKSSALCEN